MLPLLVFPFVTLAFWALGGGKGAAQATGRQQAGLNTTLPDAQLSKGSLDKMSLYAQATADSLAKKSMIKNDLFNNGDTTQADSAKSGQAAGDSSLKNTASADEIKIRARLAELQKAISRPTPQAPVPGTTTGIYGTGPDMSAQLNRLEQMMQAMNGNGQADPQTQQLNGMLEKILDIEHPDHVKQQLKEQSEKNRGRVFPVTRPQEQQQADLLGADNPATQNTAIAANSAEPDNNGFFDIDDHGNAGSDLHASIPAVVQATQTVTSGATIKLRITDDIFIDGVLIPQNTFVYGACSVEGDRLKISLTGIRFHNNVFPVSLSVYDLDALEGIRIPDAIGREASKEGADRGIQSVELTTLDPSVGAQAASAGLEAAKGLFSKKVRLVRVTVKAGYPILLIDQKARQDDK